MNAADIPNINRRSVRPGSNNNIFNVSHGLDITLSANEIFLIGQFDDFTADIIIGAHHGTTNVIHGDAKRFHFVGIDIDLILFYKSAD